MSASLATQGLPREEADRVLRACTVRLQSHINPIFLNVLVAWGAFNGLGDRKGQGRGHLAQRALNGNLGRRPRTERHRTLRAPPTHISYDRRGLLVVQRPDGRVGFGIISDALWKLPRHGLLQLGYSMERLDAVVPARRYASWRGQE
eukprot:scaffold53920_cov31-Tisochrysis_lutea.AAC.3